MKSLFFALTLLVSVLVGQSAHAVSCIESGMQYCTANQNFSCWVVSGRSCSGQGLHGWAQVKYTNSADPGGCPPDGCDFSIYLGGFCTAGITPCNAVSAASVQWESQYSTCESGSIIQTQRKAVGESVPVIGTPFDLVYFSDRVTGRTSHYDMRIPLTGSNSLNTLDSQTITIKDALGNTLFTQTDQGSSLTTEQYLSHSLGVPNPIGPGPQKVILSYEQTLKNLSQQEIDDWESALGGYVSYSGYGAMQDPGIYIVGGYRPITWGLGGWTLSVHHFYSSVAERIYLGDGSSQKAKATLFNFAGDSTDYWAVVADQRGPAPDVFIFGMDGRHIKTLQGLTGSPLYTFAYTGSGQLSSITDAHGKVTTISRDGTGDFAAITAPYGQVTNVTLDTNKYLATITNPNSETHEMTYSAFGLLLTFETPGGKVSTMTYNSAGELTSDSSNSGASRTLGATSNASMSGLGGPGYVFTSTTALNRSSVHGVRQLGTGEEWSSISPDGSVRSGTFDTSSSSVSYRSAGFGPATAVYENRTPDSWLGSFADQVYEITETHGAAAWNFYRTKTGNPAIASNHANSTPAIFQYSSMNWTTYYNSRAWLNSYNSSTGDNTTTSPEGRSSVLKTNLSGQPTSYQLASYSPTTFAYDTDGRLEEVEQGTRQTSITYGSDGFVSTVTNPASQTMSFAYDNSGRVTSQTLPDTRVISYTYNADGRLASITPPGKTAHTFSWNLFEWIASYLPPYLGGTSPPPTHYSYNSDGQITEIERPNGDLIQFGYDSTTGQNTSVTIPSGQISIVQGGGLISEATSVDGYKNVLTYQGYLPNLDTLTNAATLVTVGSVGHGYGNDLVPTSSVVTPGSGSASTIAYLYDNDVLLKKTGNLTINRSATSGFITTTVISKISDSRGYDSTYSEPSTYVAQYNPTPGTPTVFLNQTFTRDALGRIATKSETVLGTTTTYAYTYDSTGRLVDVDVNSAASSNYTYDTNSNRTSGNVAGVPFTATYDAQDRLTAYNTETFTYNLNGELSSRTDSATSQTTNYTFDALGNLKQVVLPAKTLNYKTDAFGRRVARLTGTTVNSYYLYDNQLQIAAVLNSSLQITHRFIYGTKSNVPDYMVRSGTTYRIISDERGSVRFVVNVSNGVVSQRMDYDEFGRVTSDTSPGFQPFGFAGGLYDPDTKLTHFGAREYDGSIGRFVQKEPIPFYGADPNLYGYAFNDPINFVDLDGLAAQSAGEGTAYVPPSSFGEVSGTISPLDFLAGGGSFFSRLLGPGGGGRIIGIQFGNRPPFHLDYYPTRVRGPFEWHYHTPWSPKTHRGMDPLPPPNACENR